MNEKIVEKIKKCLALGASANEHESAAALRQARKLMEQHNITGVDIDAAQASEKCADAGAKTKPANWEVYLANQIASVFCCRLIFSGGFWNDPGTWHFIGCGSDPEIAHYAFTVLNRQARKARDHYIKTRLKRCKRYNKTRRADLFSEGWVKAVAGKISAYAGSDQNQTVIDAYVIKQYPSLATLESTDRNAGRNLRDHEHDDYFNGIHSGKDAQLSRGVGGSSGQHLLGSEG